MITIETTTLKEILSKVGKCAGNDKNFPMTQLLNIAANSNELKFTTTNGIDTCVYTYTDSSKTFEDFNITVLVEQFSKLISKFTCATVSLSKSDTGNEIIVSGNGEYKISLPLDRGEPIVYPELTVSLEPITDIFSHSVATIINASKCCEGAITKVTSDLTIEEYPNTNYYFNEDGCITLDGFKATWYNSNGVLPFETLINPSTIKLLSIFDLSTDFQAYKSSDSDLIFKSDNILLVSKEAQGRDAYAFEPAIKLIDAPFEHKVVVAPLAFVSALERLKLFISLGDDNSIKLNFGKDGVTVSTFSGCTEYISSESVAEFEAYIDIDYLMSQLKAYGDTPVELYYGNEQYIKLFADEIKQIVVLCDVDE